MDTDTIITKTALKFLCGETEQVCRLCLQSTNTNEIYLSKPIHIKKPYLEETVSYMDILIEFEIPTESELPQVLCKDCANTVLSSYLFHKLLEYSNNKWNMVFNKFDDALNSVDSINPSTRSLYVLVNDNDNLIYSTRNKMNTKKEALGKIKSILKSRDYYVKHYKKPKLPIVLKDDDLQCATCGRNFLNKTLLIKHMSKHIVNNEKYSCPKCAKVFYAEKQLNDHFERIHEPKKLSCKKCGKRFSTTKMLVTHEKLYHVPTMCKLCYIKLPSRYLLRTHLDKHQSNKCPKCNKSYSNKNTYKLHLKICGETDKPLQFFCDICGKGYVHKNGLRTHLKVYHNFGVVLSCSWCNKRFDALSRLNNHIVKHTRERKFCCQVCGNKFVTQAALVYHTRLHTGEKPFPCDICDETFLSASRRMEHKKRKHFGPTKECHICHMKFVMGHQLKKHVVRHYNPQSKLYTPSAIDESPQIFYVENE